MQYVTQILLNIDRTAACFAKRYMYHSIIIRWVHDEVPRLKLGYTWGIPHTIILLDHYRHNVYLIIKIVEMFFLGNILVNTGLHDWSFQIVPKRQTQRISSDRYNVLFCNSLKNMFSNMFFWTAACQILVLFLIAWKWWASSHVYGQGRHGWQVNYISHNFFKW